MGALSMGRRSRSRRRVAAWPRVQSSNVLYARAQPGGRVRLYYDPAGTEYMGTYGNMRSALQFAAIGGPKLGHRIVEI